MLSDKQIQKMAKAIADISAIINIHPFKCLYGISGISDYCGNKALDTDSRCMKWFFDNQQSYPFSITKQDMNY